MSVPDCTRKGSQPRHTSTWRRLSQRCEGACQLADVLETRSGRAGFTRQKGESMGDRGGKKDKKKSQQQLATKQKHKEQRKLDKAPSRPLAATT